MTARREILSREVYQGTIYPIPITIYAAADPPFDDLTIVDVSVEVYRGDGSRDGGSWPWTTDTVPVAAGDPIIGHVTPPNDGSGFPTAREVVHMVVILTPSGQQPFEATTLALTVRARSGL